MATEPTPVPTLSAGDPAPDFRLQTDQGTTLSLSDFRGKTVVLYFYPKAATPGCTTEACEFRDFTEGFTNRNAIVLGISPDAPGAQHRFRQKYELPFPLLCDVEKAAAQAYGVWKEKNMYGKKVMGIERTTFVIGEDGRIRKIYPKVKAQGHAAKVLENL